MSDTLEVCSKVSIGLYRQFRVCKLVKMCLNMNVFFLRNSVGKLIVNGCGFSTMLSPTLYKLNLQL